MRISLKATLGTARGAATHPTGAGGTDLDLVPCEGTEPQDTPQEPQQNQEPTSEDGGLRHRQHHEHAGGDEEWPDGTGKGPLLQPGVPGSGTRWRRS